MPTIEDRPEEREPKEGRPRFGVRSEANEKRPNRNEDAYAAIPERDAYAVFDGMSIPRGGEIAAQTAARIFETKMMSIPERIAGGRD